MAQQRLGDSYMRGRSRRVSRCLLGTMRGSNVALHNLMANSNDGIANFMGKALNSDGM